jgi:hypothetical protein
MRCLRLKLELMGGKMEEICCGKVMKKFQIFPADVSAVFYFKLSSTPQTIFNNSPSSSSTSNFFRTSFRNHIQLPPNLHNKSPRASGKLESATNHDLYALEKSAIHDSNDSSPPSCACKRNATKQNCNCAFHCGIHFILSLRPFRFDWHIKDLRDDH